MASISPFWIVVAVVVVLLLVRGQLQEHRRHNSIRAWAGDHGWEYQRSDRHLGRSWTSPSIGHGTAKDVVHRTFPEADVFSYDISVWGGMRRRHITGIDLGARVPTAVIVGVGQSSRHQRQLTRVTPTNESFSMRWDVLAPEDQQVRVQQLLTDEFCQRLLRDDEVLRFAVLTFEDHHLLLSLPWREEPGHTHDAVSLLRDLVATLTP